MTSSTIVAAGILRHPGSVDVSPSNVKHADFLRHASLALCPSHLRPLMERLFELYPMLNERAYSGALKPERALSFQLTAYGGAAALYRTADEVIVIRCGSESAPNLREAADRLLHEMAHAYISEVLHEDGSLRGDSSHNNPVWCQTITDASLALGWKLPGIAKPVTVRRSPKSEGGRLTRAARPGYLERKQLGRWPHSLRPDGYYESDAAPIFSSAVGGALSHAGETGTELCPGGAQ